MKTLDDREIYDLHMQTKSPKEINFTNALANSGIAMPLMIVFGTRMYITIKYCC